VAAVLQVSRQTVNTLRRAGALPSVRCADGTHRYPEDAIRQLVNVAPGERLLRRKEAAALLGVGRQTVTDHELAGRLPSVRLPGSRERRYPESEVRRLAAECQATLTR